MREIESLRKESESVEGQLNDLRFREEAAQAVFTSLVEKKAAVVAEGTTDKGREKFFSLNRELSDSELEFESLRVSRVKIEQALVEINAKLKHAEEARRQARASYVQGRIREAENELIKSLDELRRKIVKAYFDLGTLIGEAFLKGSSLTETGGSTIVNVELQRFFSSLPYAIVEGSQNGEYVSCVTPTPWSTRDILILQPYVGPGHAKDFKTAVNEYQLSQRARFEKEFDESNK